MKAVIFAGGVGTRLWPLSRKKSPKQFEKIVGGKSTLQLAVERLLPEFSYSDIFIATDASYVPLVKAQLPHIPQENIIGEPCRRDVGPAVALAMAMVAKKAPQEPVVILWSDHLVKQEEKFKNIIFAAGKVVEEKKNKIVFIGQKARFASDNMGWIEFGAQVRQANGQQLHAFKGFLYKPTADVAQKWFADGHHCWNLGYFVSTPQFVLEKYQQLTPEIYSVLKHILDADFKKEALEEYYGQMPKMHFDNALPERLHKEEAYVIVDDIGWSDVGAWEALKEALEQHREDNVTAGKTLLQDCKDNLVYNYEPEKLVVGIDLNELLVVNTADVLLIVNKKSVSKVKKLVESFESTELEHLT